MQNVFQLQPPRNRALQIETRRYAKCVEASRRIRWDIERDVIRGRTFDLSRKFLPDSLSKVTELEFLSADEWRLLSQIQGRTYANMLGLVERFIAAKMIELSSSHTLGDQTALEALVRFTDDELKHQELFRRIDRLAAAELPHGYRFTARANDLAWLVLGKSSWAVLALTCMIELLTQSHYRKSIECDGNLSPLYKDVFLFHWKEEAQHAALDELEWRREDAKLTPKEREAAVEDFMALLNVLDGLIQQQAKADASYFLGLFAQPLSNEQQKRVAGTILRAYRGQYILMGIENERFTEVMAELTRDEQGTRIARALLPIAERASG